MLSFIIITTFATFHHTLADVPSYIPPELNSVLAYQSSRFSECNDFVRTCHPGTSSCASWICQECTRLGQTALEACCATDTAPSSCLATALLLPASASAGQITPAAATATPTITAAPSGGAAACGLVAKSISECNSLTPGFTSSAFELQAPCLCYDTSRSFAPTLYDSPLQSCLSYISTESPGAYASLNSAGPVTSAPCSSIGDIVHSILTTGSYATRTSASPSPTTHTTSSSAGAAKRLLGDGAKLAAAWVAFQDLLVI